jgi:hypothetical protein
MELEHSPISLSYNENGKDFTLPLIYHFLYFRGELTIMRLVDLV